MSKVPNPIAKLHQKASKAKMSSSARSDQPPQEDISIGALREPSGSPQGALRKPSRSPQEALRESSGTIR